MQETPETRSVSSETEMHGWGRKITPSRFTLFFFWLFAISSEKTTSRTRQLHFLVLCERPRSSWCELGKMLSAAASGLVHLQLCCLGGGPCALVAVVTAACAVVCSIYKLVGVKPVMALNSAWITAWTRTWTVKLIFGAKMTFQFSNCI